MMMPANFSAVAENELTYVVGGASLVDYLAPAMKAENWQNVSANVIKIVGNTFLKSYVSSAFDSVFDGNYVPGDFIGGVWNTVHRAYEKGFHTYQNTQWGAALGILNAALSIAGGLSAIYTLGSSSIGLDIKDAGTKPLNTDYGFGYKG
ncbi:MAG: hypothetical protein PUH52_05875 [Faecalibacterium sp.]|nr:hypothetical protein [Faecalibacterium sp.]MDY5503457.1 hypothetical protein [Faecalibacterium sp.]